MNFDIGIQNLRHYFHFPPQKPTLMFDGHGWLSRKHERIFKQFISGDTKLIIELGSWLGKSTRWLADNAPRATVIAVDTWLGSCEHFDGSPRTDKLPNLYEQFLLNCWEYQDRIIPMRLTTVSALRLIYNQKLKPDIIYIDAGHEYWDVAGDIGMSHELFPHSLIIGDDYYRRGVNKAVTEFCEKAGLSLCTKEQVWWITNENL